MKARLGKGDKGVLILAAAEEVNVGERAFKIGALLAGC